MEHNVGKEVGAGGASPEKQNSQAKVGATSEAKGGRSATERDGPECAR